MSRRVQLPVRSTKADEARGRGGEGANAGSAAPAFGRVAPSPPPPTAPSEAREREVAGLWRALGEVMDPEFPISIVDLGLVYGIRRSGDVVEVDLTFTASACPCMDFIEEDVRERLLQEAGVREVLIRHVWSPPWTRDRISAEGLAVLRRHGVAA